MVNLNKYSLFTKYFVLLLTFAIFISCSEKKYFISKIEGKKISISDKLTATSEIDAYIKPFREHIDTELNTVLAYNPETLDKSTGKWQTNIGSFLADVVFLKGNEIFLKRENKKIDLCLLNHGGIRSILPQGNITARNAFEVMPFENTSVVVSLKSEEIIALVNYIIAEKKPHPLNGITFEISKSNLAQNILIQGKPLEMNRIYYVITNDYLANGGDNMVFFKINSGVYDLNYKLRNMLIDYFKDVGTLKVNNDIRIKQLDY